MTTRKIRYLQKKLREAQAELRKADHGRGYYVHNFYIGDRLVWVDASSEEEAMAMAERGMGEEIDVRETAPPDNQLAYPDTGNKPSGARGHKFLHHLIMDGVVDLVIRPFRK
jgi:hypothetical protein